MTFQEELDAILHAVKNYQSLSQWADKNCKTCWGKGRMRQTHGESKVEVPCDCIAYRIGKLENKLSPLNYEERRKDDKRIP